MRRESSIGEKLVASLIEVINPESPPWSAKQYSSPAGILLSNRRVRHTTKLVEKIPEETEVAEERHGSLLTQGQGWTLTYGLERWPKRDYSVLGLGPLFLSTDRAEESGAGSTGASEIPT
ncbi:hypothetical protein MRX96_028215 [Rhipicephalus microplus]